ncbi:MAG: hypothetical protein ACRD18_08250 [Terriglobia bacterium]
MKKAGISMLIVGLLLASAYIWRGAPRLNRVQASPIPAQDQSMEAMPQEIDFAYYTVREGFNSTLRLVSDSPKPLNFVLVYYSLDGKAIQAPPMTIQPQVEMSLDLRKEFSDLPATGDFSEGSLAVQFTASGMTPLARIRKLKTKGLAKLYEI